MGERVIPFAPYVRHKLASLPCRNGWVFAAGRMVSQTLKNIMRRVGCQEGQETAPFVGVSKADHIAAPNWPHTETYRVAGLSGLSLHGLCRSFNSLTEWLEIPAGVAAQIIGPQALRHPREAYTVRPLDLLRVHHQRI